MGRGAGDRVEHNHQDCGEIYWVYLVQKELERRNLSHIGKVNEKEESFNNYCLEKGITDSFKKSPYKKNMDLTFIEFVDKLVEKFPGKEICITNVETEYRNLGKKGDSILSFNDSDDIISISLKNYKERGGFNNIQLKSCTYNSLLNNFVLKRDSGPGKCIDCDSGKMFMPQSEREIRDNNYKFLGHEDMLEDVYYFDDMNDRLKQKWIYSEERMFYTQEVQDEWAADRDIFGYDAVDRMILALNKLEKKDIQEKLMVATGMYCDGDSEVEELLLIGPGGTIMCSLFNAKYKELLERINNKESYLSYEQNLKRILFSINDSDGEIITFNIPFTLNLSGAYVTTANNVPYEGLRKIPGEKYPLSYHERRPRKCRHLATSTNIKCNLMKHL